MSSNSIYTTRPNYAREREKLREAPVSARNKELIEAFFQYLFAKGVSEGRIVKLSWQLRRLAELVSKDFDSATREDIERVMLAVNTQELSNRFGVRRYSASTRKDYGRMLKQFYKWLRQTDRAPPEVKWIQTRLSQKEKKLNLDLLTWEDMRKATQQARNPKEAALVNFLYESGGRIGEVLAMRIRDVQFKDRYAKAHLDGKTGDRWIPLVTSVPYLATYLNSHPNRDDGAALLWLSHSNSSLYGPLHYHAAAKLVKRLFARAGIKKRCNPHSFRHSRATELAKKMTEPQMRLYFGWERGSETPSVYTHLSGRDVDSVILGLHGIGEVEEHEAEKPKACALCQTINQPAARFCTKCGYALSGEAALEAEEEVRREMDKTMQYFYEVAKNPEMMKRFEEFRHRFIQKQSTNQ